MRAAHAHRAFMVTGVCWAAVAAFLPCDEAAAQDRNSPFRPERFDEDWRNVATENAPFGAQFKNLDVAPNVTLSIGGDARWRLSYQDAPRLGITGEDADEWLLQRLLLHADLRFGEDVRLFLQLGAHDGIGRETPSASDDNGPDVQQAFIDLNGHGFGGRMTLRAGRQELVLGPRFVTARDSNNARQRHDMVRAIVQSGPWRADLFAGSPVNNGHGAFDDSADDGEEFYGVRVQRSSGPVTTEVYAYELDRNTASLTGMTANDDRVSLGARVYGRSGDWDFDAEAVFQSGAFGDQEIAAFGSTLDIGHHFADAPWRPRLGARFTYGSGDSDLTDDTQGTFAPPFVQGTWFGQNGLASFSNITDIAATLDLAPRQDLSISLKFSAAWRSETADFAYSMGAALPGTSNADDDYLGVSPSALIVWRMSENVSMNAYASYAFIGDELRAVGGDDVAYAHIGASLRF